MSARFTIGIARRAQLLVLAAAVVTGIGGYYYMHQETKAQFRSRLEKNAVLAKEVGAI